LLSPTFGITNNFPMMTPVSFGGIAHFIKRGTRSRHKMFTQYTLRYGTTPCWAVLNGVALGIHLGTGQNSRVQDPAARHEEASLKGSARFSTRKCRRRRRGIKVQLPLATSSEQNVGMTLESQVRTNTLDPSL
jgi:hypothetical protein